MERELKGRPLVAGRATGQLIVSHQPISLWGGLRQQTGDIIDQRHDCCGMNVAGKVFAFPSEKGSSTGSAILLEAIKLGNAPVAILTSKVTPTTALGAIMAEEMYGKTVPVVVLSEADYRSLESWQTVTIEPDGVLRVVGE